MIEIIWAEEAKIQYLKVIGFLFDKWGEQVAFDFEDKVKKIEALISTGTIKFSYSKTLGLEKCVIDEYNSLILKRNNHTNQIIAFIDNRSDHIF